MKRTLQWIVNTLSRVPVPSKRALQWIFGILAGLGLVFAGIFHNHPFIFTIGTIELVLTAIVVNLFVFFYLRRNWRSTAGGKSIMYSKMGFALLADMTILTLIMGADWEWRGIVRLIAFTLVLVTQGNFLYLLYKLRNTESREEYELHHDDKGRKI